MSSKMEIYPSRYLFREHDPWYTHSRVRTNPIFSAYRMSHGEERPSHIIYFSDLKVPRSDASPALATKKKSSRNTRRSEPRCVSISMEIGRERREKSFPFIPKKVPLPLFHPAPRGKDQNCQTLGLSGRTRHTSQLQHPNDWNWRGVCWSTEFGQSLGGQRDFRSLWRSISKVHIQQETRKGRKRDEKMRNGVNSSR